jgi:trans-aconitate 2-methyltransferase
MSRVERSSYAFGDSQAAAERLSLVAGVFEPPSREFLNEFKRADVDLAVDLGCGPGLTTRLVRDVIGPHRVVGLDTSDSFLELARGKKDSEVSFLRHDVTVVPFPVEPADLIYCRFLVTHLQDAEATLKKWATQLRSSGLLLLEEVESIETSSPFFTMYLEIVGRLLDSRGSKLLIGPVLDSLADLPQMERLSSRVRQHRVDPRAAARMFRLNLESWRRDPQLIEEDRAALPELLTELERISADGSSEEIVWSLRQIAFKHR